MARTRDLTPAHRQSVVQADRRVQEHAIQGYNFTGYLVLARLVAKGFETAVILTVDGNTVSGIVKAENDDSIDLIKADASIVRLKLDDIEARRTGKSSMPEDLVTKLTPRQLRDLVAYLFSLKTDPRAADEVEWNVFMIKLEELFGEFLPTTGL